MKHLLIISCSALILIFSSCDNDFTINDHWKDITVIYGLLDPAEDTNWVRVQRAYLGSDPASASFDNPDSLYYEDVDVILEGFEILDNNQLGARQDSFVLIKDETTKQKDSGVFTTDGFKMYRTPYDVTHRYDINEDYVYKITVQKRNATYPDASSTSKIVGGEPAFRFIAPNPSNPTAKIFNGRVEWYASKNAKIYEVDMYIKYKELDQSTGNVEHLVQKIDYGTIEGSLANVDPPAKLDMTKQTNEFYKDIGASFPPHKPNTLRFIKTISLVVWAGGEDLAKYIELNKPSLGLNADKPEFPDIENGVGLFSSRTSILIDNVPLSPELESKYYMSQRLCSEGFAIVTSGDTCYCQRVEGTDLKQICF